MIRTQPIAEHIIAAPTGPLIVPATGAGAAQPVLSLVVPTLNESENITDFLAAVRHTLDQALPGRYEVIVVDDDSRGPHLGNRRPSPRRFP